METGIFIVDEDTRIEVCENILGVDDTAVSLYVISEETELSIFLTDYKAIRILVQELHRICEIMETEALNQNKWQPSN